MDNSRSFIVDGLQAFSNIVYDDTDNWKTGIHHRHMVDHEPRRIVLENTIMVFVTHENLCCIFLTKYVFEMQI